MSALNSAQLQAATQRIIVSSSSPGQIKSEQGTPTAIQPKSISSAQLQLIRQQTGATFKQHVRVQSGALAGQTVKSSTVTIGGQPAVVQFTQAQPRAQFVRQGTVTLGGKGGITRTVTESEVSQLLKKQQQQKAMSGAIGTTQSSIQGISSHVLAHAVQQASTSGASVAATLVKAVSNAGGGKQLQKCLCIYNLIFDLNYSDSNSDNTGIKCYSYQCRQNNDTSFASGKFS